MGLSDTPHDMYWGYVPQQYVVSEGAYEPGCGQSPTMPHIQHNDQISQPPHHHDLQPIQHNAPLTPSSSSSTSSHAPFVSPSSDRGNYVSPGPDTGSTGVGSPAPAGGATAPSDCSSYISTRGNNNVGNGSGSGCEVSYCAGCSERILDRYYLMAVERKWHARCLRCAECHLPLETHSTCFAKDGQIYCRTDYQRLYNLRQCARCARCSQSISSSEMVMRACDHVYHVQCFTCATCHITLTKGDQFGMHGHLIFCREHHQATNPLDGGNVSPLGIPPGTYPGGPIPNIPPLGHGGNGGPISHHLPPEALQLFPPSDHVAKIQFFNGVGTPHKGRPRKRKPKDEPMDTNMNIPSGYDLESAYGLGSSPCNNVRAKRIRTSFKHHQLRTMKAYFALNHNPDAKDLKQLSQKTGLSKRVLQVWFQNARAKWRRNLMSKDPKALVGSGGGDTGSETGNPLSHEGAGDSSGEYISPSPAVSQPPMSPDDNGGPASQMSYQQMF